MKAITWLWAQPNGRAKFVASHVNIWAAMLRRHCSLKLQLACVTDMPEGIDPSVEIISPPGFHEGLQTSRWRGGKPSCYRRLAMFAPDAARIFGDRFVSMDLDLLISGNIDAILDRAEDFIICGPSTIGSRWLYNGSMMMLTAGARPSVYESFTPEKAEVASRQFVGSDQAWIAYALGRGEATWGPADGVVRWGTNDAGPLMFFPGNVKPWNAIAHPFIGEHYRLDTGRSGIILGDGRSVWDDAAKAGGPFDAIIALPKAAGAWNGRIDYVAENMMHALLLAKMLGIERPVVCGDKSG